MLPAQRGSNTTHRKTSAQKYRLLSRKSMSSFVSHRGYRAHYQHLWPGLKDKIERGFSCATELLEPARGYYLAKARFACLRSQPQPDFL